MIIGKGISPHIRKIFGYNPLTEAWINATGENNAAIITAANNFEQLLINNSLTSKLLAVYFCISADATKNSFNFMNPALFQVSWSGGLTHSSDGILGNGTNGYGNTGINPVPHLTIDDIHISCYSQTNSAAATAAMGVYSGTDYLQILPKWSDNNYYAQMNDANFTTAAMANSTGYFVATRSGTTRKAYRNGTEIHSVTTATTAEPNGNIFLFARNNIGVPAPSNYSARKFFMFTVGSGLTPTNVTNLNNAVAAFKTELGI